MIKTIFLIQCICSSFGYVQDWFPPANHHRHQFFPHNHNNVNVKNRHPYSWENQYISGSESTRNNVNSNKVLSASKYSFNRPLRYLKPPAINAASSYDKFRTYFDSLDYDDLPPNHRPDVAEENSNKKKKNQEERPKYIRDHAPLHQNSESETMESKIKEKKKSKSNDELDGLKLSDDGDRIEFQISGHDGPQTYVFGFDTGDGKNRQFRLEEKLKNGTVKGQYGYYDARGKLRKIKYLAGPIEGYEEKHHESSNLLSSPYE